MELTARVSKGSKMDQIYIPKNRAGFDIGSYVLVSPVEKEIFYEKPIIYGLDYIESVKLEIIQNIFKIIGGLIDSDNIIITGSFLNKGFCFNDIDILLIKENEANISLLEKKIYEKIDIKTHIIKISSNQLLKGLSEDPLYQVMISKCISRKRFFYRFENKINFKVLDFHLLKSKNLIDSFDILNGNEKYYFTRNMISIKLFLSKKKVNQESIDTEIKKEFGLGNIDELKQNIVGKKFLKEYIKIYNNLFNNIMEGIKNGAKQK